MCSKLIKDCLFFFLKRRISGNSVVLGVVPLSWRLPSLTRYVQDRWPPYDTAVVAPALDAVAPCSISMHLYGINPSTSSRMAGWVSFLFKGTVETKCTRVLQNGRIVDNSLKSIAAWKDVVFSLIHTDENYWESSSFRLHIASSYVFGKEQKKRKKTGWLLTSVINIF